MHRIQREIGGYFELERYSGFGFHLFAQLVRLAFNRKAAAVRREATRGTFIGYSWECDAIGVSDLFTEELSFCLV